MKKQIIDIGLNLMHKQFDLDREDVVKRAEKENVTPLIITGVHLNNGKLCRKTYRKIILYSRNTSS